MPTNQYHIAVNIPPYFIPQANDLHETRKSYTANLNIIQNYITNALNICTSLAEVNEIFPDSVAHFSTDSVIAHPGKISSFISQHEPENKRLLRQAAKNLLLS